MMQLCCDLVFILVIYLRFVHTYRAFFSRLCYTGCGLSFTIRYAHIVNKFHENCNIYLLLNFPAVTQLYSAIIYLHDNLTEIKSHQKFKFLTRNIVSICIRV